MLHWISISLPDHHNHCRGILLLVPKQIVHSAIDKPLSLSRSQSFNSFLPHFLPLLMFPRYFFIGGMRNSLETRSLSLFLSRRLNFHIKTWLSVRTVPWIRRSPDLALLLWFLIKVSMKQKQQKKWFSVLQTKMAKINYTQHMLFQPKWSTSTPLLQQQMIKIYCLFLFKTTQKSKPICT